MLSINALCTSTVFSLKRCPAIKNTRKSDVKENKQVIERMANALNIKDMKDWYEVSTKVN